MAISAVPKLFLSATQICVWWTPHDPNLKHRMKKSKIVWIIFGSKLLSYLLMSAIYFLLKCPRYRQTQTS